MNSSIFALAPLALFFGSFSPARAQTIWSVTPAGGADILQNTIDSATDGDWILIVPGTYASALLAGKGVHLIGLGASPSEVVLSAPPQQPGGAFGPPPVSPLEVRDLSSNSRCWIANVTLEGGSIGSPALRVSDCAGEVLVDEVSAQPHNGGVGVLIEDSTLVSLNRVEAVSLAFPSVAHTGSAGAWISDSNVFVRESLFVAQQGFGPWSGPDARGASGIDVDGSSRIHLENTSAIASTYTWTFPLSGFQAAGLDLDGASEAWLAGGPSSELLGADGFLGNDGAFSGGGPGLRAASGSAVRLGAMLVATGGLDGGVGPMADELVLEPGAVAQLFGETLPRIGFGNSIVDLGESFDLQLSGEPFGVILPAVSTGNTGPLSLPLGGAWAWLDLNPVELLVLPAVGLSGSGDAAQGLKVPNSPSAAWTTLWFQGFALNSTSLTSSTPAALLIQG